MQIFNTAPNGYRFNKLIFYAPIVIALLIFIEIAYEYNFDFSPRYYVKCIYGICENPFVNDPKCGMPWCSQSMLAVGEYGEKTPQGSYSNFVYLMLGMILASLSLNHVLHNRGKKFQFVEPIHSFLEGLDKVDLK